VTATEWTDQTRLYRTAAPGESGREEGTPAGAPLAAGRRANYTGDSSRLV